MLKNCEKLFAGRSTRSYVESKRATRPQIRCGYPLSADNVTLFCIGVLLTSTLDESLLRKLRTPVIEIKENKKSLPQSFTYFSEAELVYLEFCHHF
jgi:hypothetical protein